MRGAGRGCVPGCHRPPGPAPALCRATRFRQERRAGETRAAGAGSWHRQRRPRCRLRSCGCHLVAPRLEGTRDPSKPCVPAARSPVTAARLDRGRRGRRVKVACGSFSLFFLCRLGRGWAGSFLSERADLDVVRRLTEFLASASGSHKHRARCPGRDIGSASGCCRPGPGSTAPAGLGRGRAHGP